MSFIKKLVQISPAKPSVCSVVRNLFWTRKAPAIKTPGPFLFWRIPSCLLFGMEGNLLNDHIDHRQRRNLGKAVDLFQVNIFRDSRKERLSHPLVCLTVAKLRFQGDLLDPLGSIQTRAETGTSYNAPVKRENEKF